ncbi:glycosyltransferase family 4 protein [Herbaspirillum sp. LeCh32-8]|uniref:glycosyltransferase family 4 protein n=1 Tax=Herbaspirillum sp. LeCh32-8 TaxID=2821356 RepID=UPI001AE4A9BF|nr:glycosyltransferase family 4 protein [Herbaspirillum sp. LeCh32-8]MBP0598387.1 glycosyltransferase family 4 protein [Herbaspirillum sp. LeCh32-8]
MKILFCCEFFHPSVGGAQEVVKQIALRLAARGHQVGVATSFLENRQSDQYRGVAIHAFNVRGNKVKGMSGEIERYRNFIRDGAYDLIFIYAAQQWTLDAILDDLPHLKTRTVLVPCGYSGLPDPAYRDYFAQLPDVLRSFDALVYHAHDYRDVRFAAQHGLDNSVFVPNGADDLEFAREGDGGFRRAQGMVDDELLLLTVGSLNGAKGHLEIAEAFARAEIAGKATLVLNGNAMPPTGDALGAGLRKLLVMLKARGAVATMRFVAGRLLHALGFRPDYWERLRRVMDAVNRRPASGKRILMIDLPRQELIGAFLEADLFVFASLIEYSPLVLFEACAAGLPFLTVPVGNSREIVEWTQGGELCPAPVDGQGFTRVDPQVLGAHIARLAADPARLAELSANGRRAWQEHYNWDTISRQYEALFSRLLHSPKQA